MRRAYDSVGQVVPFLVDVVRLDYFAEVAQIVGDGVEGEDHYFVYLYLAFLHISVVPLLVLLQQLQCSFS